MIMFTLRLAAGMLVMGLIKRINYKIIIQIKKIDYSDNQSCPSCYALAYHGSPAQNAANRRLMVA